MPFKKIRFKRIGSFYNPVIPPPVVPPVIPPVIPPVVEPPIPPLPPPVPVPIETYRGIVIYYNMDQQYEWKINGVLYLDTDLNTAKLRIDAILDTPPPPPPPPPPEPVTIIVNSTILQTVDLDGLGLRTYKRGSGLGSNPIMKVQNCTVKNCIFEDLAGAGGSNGLLAVTGTGVLDGNKVTCEPTGMNYGIIATRPSTGFKIINNTAIGGIHGISGSSGSDGEFKPSFDGLIENNIIYGQTQHGIKLKNFVRCHVRGNKIDESGEHTGIIFGAGDASSVDCIVENNIITNVYYGIVANQDSPISTTPSTGNLIQNNSISNAYWGIILKGNNYTVKGNSYLNVRYPIRNDGQNNVVDNLD